MNCIILINDFLSVLNIKSGDKKLTISRDTYVKKVIIDREEENLPITTTAAPTTTSEPTTTAAPTTTAMPTTTNGPTTTAGTTTEAGTTTNGPTTTAAPTTTYVYALEIGFDNTSDMSVYMWKKTSAPASEGLLVENIGITLDSPNACDYKVKVEFDAEDSFDTLYYFAVNGEEESFPADPSPGERRTVTQVDASDIGYFGYPDTVYCRISLIDVTMGTANNSSVPSAIPVPGGTTDVENLPPF